MGSVRIMDGWATVVTPIIGVVIGALLLDIRGRIKEVNSKFYIHVTDPTLHAAEAARVKEQIKNLLQTVKIAHERMDRVEGSRSSSR